MSHKIIIIIKNNVTFQFSLIKSKSELSFHEWIFFQLKKLISYFFFHNLAQKCLLTNALNICGEQMIGDRTNGESTSGEPTVGFSMKGVSANGDRISGVNTCGDMMRGERTSGDRMAGLKIPK